MSFMEDSSVDDNNKKIDMTMVVTQIGRAHV